MPSMPRSCSNDQGATAVLGGSRGACFVAALQDGLSPTWPVATTVLPSARASAVSRPASVDLLGTTALTPPKRSCPVGARRVPAHTQRGQLNVALFLSLKREDECERNAPRSSGTLPSCFPAINHTLQELAVWSGICTHPSEPSRSACVSSRRLIRGCSGLGCHVHASPLCQADFNHLQCCLFPAGSHCGSGSCGTTAQQARFGSLHNAEFWQSRPLAKERNNGQTRHHTVDHFAL